MSALAQQIDAHVSFWDKPRKRGRAEKHSSAPGPSEARLQNEMRQRADTVVKLFRLDTVNSKDYQKISGYIKEMLMPGGGMVDGDRPSAADPDLRHAMGLMVEYRAVLTWKKYINPWRHAKAYFQWVIKLDAHQLWAQRMNNFGYNKTTMTALQSKYWAACLSRCYSESQSMAVVAATNGAIAMAFKVNDIAIHHKFLVQVINEASSRQLKPETRKMFGITPDEIKAIMKKWGRSDDPVKVMVACAMGLMFLGLYRFSDMCKINAVTLLLMVQGFMIGICRRKNKQKEHSWSAVADSKTAGSIVECFKRFLTMLGYTLPAVSGKANGEGFIKCNAKVGPWVFRSIGIQPGCKLKMDGKRVDVISGDGFTMLGRKGYKKWLNTMRYAMRDCCGMSKEDSLLYGTQSMRSGGDTHLFNLGFGSEFRCDIGSWATPNVERGYLRLLCAQRLDLVLAVGL
jgi:hypothetical protein